MDVLLRRCQGGGARQARQSWQSGARYQLTFMRKSDVCSYGKKFKE
jgi:hypothetical protein